MERIWSDYMGEIIVGVITLLGTVVGTGLGSCLTNKTNKEITERNTNTQLKIADKNKEIEWLKLSRTYDFERLTYVLNPIRTIYLQSDNFLDTYLTDEKDLFGKGLHEEYINDVRKILEEFPHLITYQLQKKFYELSENDGYSDFENERSDKVLREIERAHGNMTVNPLEDFSFDNDREFINMIEKEANIIEEKYMIN